MPVVRRRSLFGICYSGGTAKGEFQVGVGEALVRGGYFDDVNLHAVAGTSVGFINAVALRYFPHSIARGVGFQADCWDQLRDTNDVWKIRIPPIESLGSNAPLRKTLKRLTKWPLPPGPAPVVEGVGWNMETGKEEFFCVDDAVSHDELVGMAMLSSSSPGLFPLEEFRGQLYTDGGISNIAPVGRLIQHGCDKILTVLCRDPAKPEYVPRSQFKTLLGQIPRFIDGVENAVLEADIREVERVNALVETGHPSVAGKRIITHHVVAPHESLGDALDFSAELGARRRAIGREAGEQLLRTLRLSRA